MILLIFFLFLFILSCTLLYILFYTIIPQISGTKPDFFSQDDTDFLKLPAVNTPFNHDKKRALVFCSPDKKFSLRRFIYAGHRTVIYLKHFMRRNMTVHGDASGLGPVYRTVRRMQSS